MLRIGLVEQEQQGLGSLVGGYGVDACQEKAQLTFDHFIGLGKIFGTKVPKLRPEEVIVVMPNAEAHLAAWQDPLNPQHSTPRHFVLASRTSYLGLAEDYKLRVVSSFDELPRMG